MQLQVASVLAASPEPHQYMHVCNWPLPPHRHLLLAPAAKCMYTTSSDNHFYQPWSLAAGTGGTTVDHNSPCSLCGPSTTHQRPHSISDVDSIMLSQQITMHPGTRASTCPHNWCPVLRSWYSQACPKLQVKLFSIKSGRDGCFSTCTDTCARLQETRRIRET